MSKSGLCCDECYQLIARRSAFAADLWLNLCEVKSRSEVFGLKLEENAHIQLLENLGYITTTETKELTLFKVHFMSRDPLGTFFCRGNCGK